MNKLRKEPLQRGNLTLRNRPTVIRNRLLPWDALEV
jgi:hypothetical protein